MNNMDRIIENERDMIDVEQEEAVQQFSLRELFFGGLLSIFRSEKPDEHEKILAEAVKEDPELKELVEGELEAEQIIEPEDELIQEIEEPEEDKRDEFIRGLGNSSSSNGGNNGGAGNSNRAGNPGMEANVKAEQNTGGKGIGDK